MALPLTGTITSAMILTELGFTGSSNVLRNVVQKPGGILQVLVNSTWVNLNMCSPYLPTPVAPYIVPTHWYGYDHGTSGVETITISGDTTIDVGQTVTYTASLTGDNLTGVVLTWSKFAGGAWVDNIATGTSVSITWTDPRDAKVRVIASNICNLNIVQKELNISYNCAPALSGDPYIGGTLEVNKSYDVWAVNGTGIVGEVGNTRLGISFFWEVLGSVILVSGQGTNKAVIRATATSTNNVIRVTITSCGTSITSSNITFDASSPVTVYYNTAQSRDIQKICDGGQIGSIVTVTRDAGTHSSTVSVADANTQANNWLYTQDAVNVAQALGTCGDTPSVPNDRMSQLFTRNNCGAQFGTTVEYVVQAGTYRAADKAAANTLAQNDINANGQNFANSTGTCSPSICTDVPYSLGINSVSTGTGSLTVNIGVGLNGGSYSVKQQFNGSELNSTISGNGYSSYNLPVFNVPAGSGTVTVTIISNCGAIVSVTSGSVTVTGALACTNGTIANFYSTRNLYTGGAVTAAINLSNYTNIRNIGGTLSYTPYSVNGNPSHSMVQTYTQGFSGIDFSGGNTVYITISLPGGFTYENGILQVNITTGDNICSLPQSSSYSGIDVISPS